MKNMAQSSRRVVNNIQKGCLSVGQNTIWRASFCSWTIHEINSNLPQRPKRQQLKSTPYAITDFKLNPHFLNLLREKEKDTQKDR